MGLPPDNFEEKDNLEEECGLEKELKKGRWKAVVKIILAIIFVGLVTFGALYGMWKLFPSEKDVSRWLEGWEEVVK